VKSPDAPTANEYIACSVTIQQQQQFICEWNRGLSNSFVPAIFGWGNSEYWIRWISDARRFREATRFLATPTGGSLDRFWQPALLTPARERSTK
jgi:hypothetical protein